MIDFLKFGRGNTHTLDCNIECKRFNPCFGAHFAQVLPLVVWHHVEESQIKRVLGCQVSTLTHKLRVSVTLPILASHIVENPGE